MDVGQLSFEASFCTLWKGWRRWQDWALERALAANWDGTAWTGSHSGDDDYDDDADDDGDDDEDDDADDDGDDDAEELEKFLQCATQEEK